MPRKGFRQFWDDICSILTPSPPDVCVQCHRLLSEVMGGRGTAHLRGGTVLNFCSQHCAHDYWVDYQRYCRSSSGRRVCGLPGCNKPCYQEGRKTHDYCGRTHAREHKDMTEAMRRDRPKWYSGGGATHGTSPGLLSRFKNAPVKFYNRGEPYYEFTNFFEAVAVIDDQHWSTTEHYFQAQKFVGTPIVEKIRMLPRPRDAFDISRDPRYSRWRRKDWEEVKEDVMYKALQAKFTQSDELRRLLVETGERKLIEHSPHDSFWGDGGDGSGRNRLGELLMKLRKELKAKAGKNNTSAPSSPAVPHVQKMYEQHKYSESSGTGFNRSNSSSDSSTSDHSPTHSSPYNAPSSSVDHSQHSYGNRHTEQSLEKKHSHTTNEENLSLNSSGAQTLIANASGPKVPPTMAMGSGGSQSFSRTCEGQIMSTPSVSQENPFELLKPVNGQPLYSEVTAGASRPQNQPDMHASQQPHPYSQPFIQLQTCQMQPHTQMQPIVQPQTQMMQPFVQPQMQSFVQSQMQPTQPFVQSQMQPTQPFVQSQMQPTQPFVQSQMQPMQPFVQSQMQPIVQPQMQPHMQTQLQPYNQSQLHSQLHSQMQSNFQKQPYDQMPQSSQAPMNPQIQTITSTNLPTSGSQPHSIGSTTLSYTGPIMTPQSSTPAMSTGPVAFHPPQSSQPYQAHPSRPSAAASSLPPQAQSNNWPTPMEH